MLSEELFNQLKKFDPDLCALLKNSLDRQITTLSLIPTDSAASPLSQYLKGSALGNDFVNHNSVEHYSRLEKMAVERVCKIFKAEHAIIRIGNAVAASRVVLQALAKPDDNILSFNLRKKEHCTGSQMQYFFIKFALEPNDFLLNFDKLRSLALLSNPKIIIYGVATYAAESKQLSNIVKEIISNVSKYYNIYGEEKEEIKSSQITIDNYLNKNIDDVKKDLTNKGLKVVFLGTGKKIINQYPLAGTGLIKEDKIFLLTDSEKILMPDILGYSKTEVMSLVNLLNINYKFEGNGYCVSQSIKKDEEILDKILEATFKLPY